VASHEEFFPVNLELHFESRPNKSRSCKERNFNINL